MYKMKRKSPSTFSSGKIISIEVMMDSQIQSAGSHQSRLIEKYKKKASTIKSQSMGMKIGFGFPIAFISILPLLVYTEIMEGIATATYTIESLLFLTSFIMGIYFLIAMIYTFMGGLFTTGALMSGNSFKWLQTLPFSKKELKNLAFMTAFRNIDIPLILLIVSFPVVMVIITQNFLVFIVCLLLSILNGIVCFSILILIGQKFSNVFKETSSNSKRANLIRIGSMLAYFVFIFATSFILQWAMRLVWELLDIFIISGPTLIQNILFSLIPFPFSLGYIIAFFIVPGQIPFQIIISAVSSLALFIILLIIVYMIAINSLHSVTETELIQKKKKQKDIKPTKQVKIEIKTESPIKSYIHKDLVTASRDMQSMIFVIMPIIYPMVFIFSLSYMISILIYSPESILTLWIIVLGAYQLIPILLMPGLLGMEESGSSILASLPMIPRDQAKAKLFLMMIIQGISLTLMAMTLTILTRSLYVLLIFAFSLPLAWVSLLSVFEMKVSLFGKLKHKYILEELNKEHKLVKWFLIVGSDIILYILIVLLGIAFFIKTGIIGTIIAILITGIVILFIFIFIFNRMFPKAEKLHFFETGGFLRNNPIIAVSLIGCLHVFFINLAAIIEIPFLLILNILFNNNLNYIFLIFMDFFFTFGFLAILYFLVIPYGFKLPNRDRNIKEYSEDIRLINDKHVVRNVLVGLASFAIFGVVVFIGANLLGTYVFSLDILFGTPSISGGIGWFLFIFMLIPGIWEEVDNRGIAIPLLLKKYDRKLTIFISGLIFGLIHSFNLIGLLFIGADPSAVYYQMIYAFFLGLSMGYMFVKTDSLIPSILYHYLIDSAGQILFNVTFANEILYGIFLIGFIGIIPSVLVILFIKLVIKDEKRE